MKRQYLYSSAQKKLSRMDNTWRDNIYIDTWSYQEWTIHWAQIEHRSYQEWTIAWRDNIYIHEHFIVKKLSSIHEETISTLSTMKLSRIDNTWRDNIYIEHRRSYQEWTIHEETISTLSTEEAIKNGQYMKRQYLHWAQKKLSRMDNTWRDNIYIEHRRSYQEWTIHEETISTLSTEEAIKNGQYMIDKKKRQYLHWAQKKLSRMDNTWRDNIYIEHRRSFFCAIKNGQYMKRQYLHWAQKKLSRMDNTWRDNIYIEHRRSYQEWTISTFYIEHRRSYQLNGQYMKRQYLHWAQKKLSRMDNTWRDNIYMWARRSSHELTIHEETISSLLTEEAIKNGQYMKRQYLHSAQKKLSRMDNTWRDNIFCAECRRRDNMDNTWRDNIYIEHRRSYQEWTIHEETIEALWTIHEHRRSYQWNGQYMKRHMNLSTLSFFCATWRSLSRIDNTWRDNIYLHRRSFKNAIHEETISTFSTEEAIKWTINAHEETILSMKRYCLFMTISTLSISRMTIHEETISTFSTEEAIKNGQYMLLLCYKRQYLHSAQKKLSRMDNTWRDMYIYILLHRRSSSRMDNTWRDNIYIAQEEAIKNGQYMKRQYLHSAQKKLSRMDNTWRDNIYIQHRRSYQEWTIHEETLSTLSTEAIKNGQYMKRHYTYIEHRRSYQEWTIHEETISTLRTRHKAKTNKTKNTSQKTKNMNNTNSPESRAWIQVLENSSCKIQRWGGNTQIIK